MLTEQRYEIILKLLEEKNSITVAEVKDLLNTSESTVRRDITALHNAGYSRYSSIHQQVFSFTIVPFEC